jgi:hypothetical protein
MSQNDLIELIFDSNEGPVALDIAGVAECAQALERLVRLIVSWEGSNESARLRLTTAGMGSIRFGFKLEVEGEIARAPGVPQRADAGPSDPMKRMAEVATILGLLIALNSATPGPGGVLPEDPRARAHSQARKHAGEEHVIKLIDEVTAAAARTEADVAILRIEDEEFILIGPGGMTSGQIGGRPRTPLATAPITRRQASATLRIKDPSSQTIQVRFEGRAFEAFIATLAFENPQGARGATFSVLTLWSSSAEQPSSGNVKVRYRILAADAVEPLEPITTPFERVDGVIVVDAAEVWR